jgi:hypothetical protein
MLKRSPALQASLRYKRPYWMMHLRAADNWRIYVDMPKPEHQRTEMAHQAWLGGLDRPYARPRCMATQPLWLAKKRFALRRPKLQGAETSLERYVLDWRERFFAFRGWERPTPDDLHVAFDLVERPLDLSYAITILNYCRNDSDIHFAEESFTIFTEACLRVDRRDVAEAALADAAKLGFWHVDADVRKFLGGEQGWYKVGADGLRYPLEGNEAENAGKAEAAEAAAAAGGSEEDDLAAELAALEAEEAALEGKS